MLAYDFLNTWIKEMQIEQYLKNYDIKTTNTIKTLLKQKLTALSLCTEATKGKILELKLK